MARWFNHRRLLRPIGERPPAEFEALYSWKKNGPTTEGRTQLIEPPENSVRFKVRYKAVVWAERAGVHRGRQCRAACVK